MTDQTTYVPPAVRITASYSATDGRGPETIEIEFNAAVALPTPDQIAGIIGVLRDASGRWEVIR